jgi:hypothetical protein
MDRRNGGAGDVAGAPDHDDEALEFVRFCHRRRHVGWPELYDEMCAVAGRRLYRGQGPEELNELGIGFGLFEMPTLAALVARVVAEDAEQRRRLADEVGTRVVLAGGRRATVARDRRRMAHPATDEPAAEPVVAETAVKEPETERPAADMPRVRLALAAGA